eukprot:TRINITY_DN3395_c0_g1_i1.p1 TRINITY_DN3395_c0_g1~~TRINITY_DN3395_c0_g1_i1.p1  ORF type:complete len:325 (+),score=41.69 TRINITY_DN3395_c0_g1_i1:110-976(+)
MTISFGFIGFALILSACNCSVMALVNKPTISKLDFIAQVEQAANIGLAGGGFSMVRTGMEGDVKVMHQTGSLSATGSAQITGNQEATGSAGGVCVANDKILRDKIRFYTSSYCVTLCQIIGDCTGCPSTIDTTWEGLIQFMRRTEEWGRLAMIELSRQMSNKKLVPLNESALEDQKKTHENFIAVPVQDLVGWPEDECKNHDLVLRKALQHRLAKLCLVICNARAGEAADAQKCSQSCPPDYDPEKSDGPLQMSVLSEKLVSVQDVLLEEVQQIQSHIQKMYDDGDLQ